MTVEDILPKEAFSLSKWAISYQMDVVETVYYSPGLSDPLVGEVVYCRLLVTLKDRLP